MPLDPFSDVEYVEEGEKSGNDADLEIFARLMHKKRKQSLLLVVLSSEQDRPISLKVGGELFNEDLE